MRTSRTGRRIAALAALVLTVLLGSCKTAGPVDLAGLSPAEVFQQAQNASDSGDYRRALAYYDGFLAKTDIAPDRAAWARYEIALLYHKMGDDDTALAKFDELLALYEKDKTLPEAPKVLAAELRASILAKRSKKPST